MTSLVMNCGFGTYIPCVSTSHVSLQSPESAVRVSQIAERDFYGKGDSRRETVWYIYNVQFRVTAALCRKCTVFKWFVKLYNILTHSNSCVNNSGTSFSKVHWSLLTEIAALLNISVPVGQCCSWF